MGISFFDTSTSLAPISEELRERGVALLDAGRYILGIDVHEQEVVAAAVAALDINGCRRSRADSVTSEMSASEGPWLEGKRAR